MAHRATGIGLYILGAVSVNIEDIGIKGQPRAISEKDIPSLAERAKIVKEQGALAINQINHGGYMEIRVILGKVLYHLRLQYLIKN